MKPGIERKTWMNWLRYALPPSALFWGLIFALVYFT